MGKVAIIKTQQNASSVEAFVSQIENEQQKADSLIIIDMMAKISKEEPKMWGASIVGFGNIRYKSPKTAREVDWFLIGFSPRKANLSLHLTIDVNKQENILQKLGKFKTGVGCLYIKRLADIDLHQLEMLIKIAIEKKDI